MGRQRCIDADDSGSSDYENGTKWILCLREIREGEWDECGKKFKLHASASCLSSDECFGTLRKWDYETRDENE